MKFAAVLALVCIQALVLTGCVALDSAKEQIGSLSKRYVEPTGSEKARLRLTSVGMTRLIPDSDCITWSNPSAGVVTAQEPWFRSPENYNNRVLGIPGTRPAKTFGEVYVEAHRPLTVFVNEGNQYIGVTFTPAKDQDYEFKVLCDGRRCYANVWQLSIDSTASSVQSTPIPLTVAKGCEFKRYTPGTR